MALFCSNLLKVALNDTRQPTAVGGYFGAWDPDFGMIRQRNQGQSADRFQASRLNPQSVVENFGFPSPLLEL